MLFVGLEECNATDWNERTGLLEVELPLGDRPIEESKE